ncbi:MAG: hypothetical protein ACLTLK_11900, partial [Oscillospiraceae bacterium]
MGKKLADIVYDRNGDGTVQSMSATGSIDGFVKLRTCFFSADHGKLAKDPKVLDQICTEIKGMRNHSEKHYTADTVGISQLVKIRYEADALVTATIYDAD